MSILSDMSEKRNYSEIVNEKGRFAHGVATGEFDKLDPSKMAKLLVKEQGSYKDAMASLQYFENRWGIKASTPELKKIEATRQALHKLFDRDKFGKPNNPKKIKK